jgi:hypothetical protein
VSKFQRLSSPLPALFVVGLGMLLVTGLATVAVWLFYRRRAAHPAVEAVEDDAMPLTGSEAAEAK